MQRQEELARILWVLRVSRGLNQEELSRKSGIPASSISEYEHGRKSPEFPTLEKLLLGMSYPLGAIDRTRRFLHDLASGDLSADEALALAPEIERMTEDVGRAASRFARLALRVFAGERE